MSSNIKIITTEKEGFLNRHLSPLPDYPIKARIITKDIEGESVHVCEWKPFKKENYIGEKMPSEGYLGTMVTIDPIGIRIGFHAWESNNSEFIYYEILN